MNDMLDDLSRMYRLFSRITDGLIPISDIFRYNDEYDSCDDRNDSDDFYGYDGDDNIIDDA